MGCSPSKGQLFTGVSAQEEKALGFETISDLLSDRTELQNQPENLISNKTALLANEEVCTAVPLQGILSSPCIESCHTAIITGGNVDVMESGVSKQEPDSQDRTCQKTSSPVSRKRLEPPTATVKSHQAVCAYLDTIIPKYESISEILDKARQTWLSLDPLVTILALQYEEINQTLEEMAAEGQQMLEDNRVNLAFRGEELDGEMYLALNDLLHRAIDKIRQVGDPVTGQSDTAIEEVTDYFGSLSHLLGEKLVVKRAAEARLKQVLNFTEAATLMNPFPKDSALHSEDSGIGADNECQNGLGRRCGQQIHSGSGASCSQNQLYVYEAEEKRAQNDDDDDDAEDTNEEEEKMKDEPKSQRKMSHCSLEGRSVCFQEQVSQRNDTWASCTLKQTDQRTNINRPRTAGNPPVPRQRKPRHSRSADYLFGKEDVMVYGQHRSRNNLQKVYKQCSVAVLPSSCQPAYAPEPPGRHAVKRLINTFSQGVSNAPNPRLCTRPSSRSRGSKRCFLPSLTNNKAGVSNNSSDPSHKILSERPEDVDVDSLPPPPPELLMENTFERNESPLGDVERHEDSNQREKNAVSDLRSMLQRKPLRPSHGSISRCSYPSRQNHVVKEQFEEDVDQQVRDDTEKKEAAQSGQVIKYSSVAMQAAIRQGYRDSDEVKTANPYSNCGPPTTPPVSRARIPPLSNSVCHRLTNPPTLLPSPNCPANGQQEASTAKSTSSVQRWTRRNSDEENDITSDSDSFYNARSIFSQVTQSTSQALRPSCRSTLPRPWGEASRGKLQATRLPQTFMRCTPLNYSQTLSDHRTSLSTDPEPCNRGGEERRGSAVQISEPEAQTSCSAFGTQQAESREIIDNQD